MARYLGHCLVFAGACLLAAAGLGAAGWIACLRASRQDCEAPLATASAAFTGAANVALGVALQERQP
jgi:hypothetical protein